MQRGFNAATIHEICSRAGVGIGTFYAHFGRKSELLQRVVTERAPVLSELISATDLSDPIALNSRLRTAVDDPRSIGLWRAWHDAVLQDGEIAKFHAQLRRRVRDELTTTIEQARTLKGDARWRVDPRVVAWTMLTLARELTIHDRDGGAPDIETTADLITQLVFRHAREA
ncbi:MAG: TetR/AcrR family transcriptional regulator [Chloroflexota bacterium]|nr:TetR/AcrR family transcriptional regulator [Chloroflexota bacterium]